MLAASCLGKLVRDDERNDGAGWREILMKTLTGVKVNNLIIQSELDQSIFTCWSGLVKVQTQIRIFPQSKGAVYVHVDVSLKTCSFNWWFYKVLTQYLETNPSHTFQTCTW